MFLASLMPSTRAFVFSTLVFIRVNCLSYPATVSAVFLNSLTSDSIASILSSTFLILLSVI